MKLHLPYQLRGALLACVCSVAALGMQAHAAVAENNAITLTSDITNGLWLTTGTTTITVNDADSYSINAVTGYNNGYTDASYEKLGTGTLTVAGYVPEWTEGANRVNNVTVSAGTLIISFGGESSGFAKGAVSVASGATLKLTAADALGYDGGDYTDTLTLTGTAASGDTAAQYATLQLAAKQTLSTNIVLNGYTRITDVSEDGSGYIKTFGGSITANGEDNVINATVTSAADGDSMALTLTGTGSLTISEVVNGKGLTVDVNTTITKYSTSSTGTISVAAGKTLTITDVSEYLAYEGEMDLASGSWNNTEVDHKGTNVWNLLTASSSSGQIIIGAAGSTAVIGGNNNDTDFSGERTIMGNYLINGDLYFNRAGNYTTATIGSTGQLEVTGDAVLSNNQHWTVKDGGKLTVGGTLGLGHSAGASYPGSLVISGETSAVTVNELKFFNSSTSTKLQMSDGSLTIGAGGVTAHNSAGYLVLNGGTLGASADWNAASAVNVTLGTAGEKNALTIDSGDYTITLNGATTFAGTIANEGTLVLNGALTISGLHDLDYTHSDSHGFASEQYWLVNGGENSSLTIADTASVDGTAYTVTKDGASAYISVSTSTTFYIRDNDETYNSANASTTGDIATATAIVLAGKGLDMATSLASTVTDGIVVEQSGTINLSDAEVALNASQVTIKEDQTLTLTGSGTYTIASADELTASSSVVFTNEDWAGTVVFSSSVFNGQNLADYGKAGSTIHLKGTYGYLAGGSNVVAANVIFENTNLAAFEATNGSSNSTLEFSGTVSGSGNFARNWSPDSAGTLNYIFSGDVSGWGNGARIRTVNEQGDTNITFKGSATDINVDVVGDGKAPINLTVDNDADVTVGGAITGNVNLTLKGEGETTLTSTSSNYSGTTAIEAGSVVVNSGVSLGSGTVTVTDGTLKLSDGAKVGGAVTVKNGETAVATISSGTTYAGGVNISKESISGGSISGASLAVNSQYKLTDVTVKSTSFDINAALQVDGTTSFDSATVVSFGTQGYIDTTSTLQLSTTGNSIKLAAAADGGLATVETSEVQFAPTLVCTRVESNQLANIALSGSGSFTIDLAGDALLTSLVAEGKDILLVFSGLTLIEDAVSAADMLGLSSTSLPFQLGETLAGYEIATTATEQLQSNFYADSNSVVVYLSKDGAKAAPEPTTSTLSLLALAALAARRRRK